LQLVSRLIVGGPAPSVCLVAANLERRQFTSWLAHGRTASGERSNPELAHQMGIEPICIDTLGRRPGFEDVRALLAIRRLVRDIRPHLLHTHTAKAGSIGRLAGVLSGMSRKSRPLFTATCSRAILVPARVAQL